MQQVEYSVIVPVYNVENVLRRCIDSILGQTVSDFELILIDDGSSDQSGIICDEYKKKDKRVKVIHQKNSGVSSARNKGLDNARGKYIVFVDSDDYIDKRYLEGFENNEVDLVITALYLCNADLSVRKVFSVENAYIELKQDSSYIYILKEWFSRPVYAKRFSRKIIDENKIRFDKTCSYGEDEIFVISYLKYIKKIQIKNELTYYYCIYEQPTLSKLKLDEKFEKHSKVLKDIYDIFSMQSEVSNFILNKYWWLAEQEINRILYDYQLKIGEKVKKIRNILNYPMSKMCLKCDVTKHIRNIIRIVYLLNKSVLIYIWVCCFMIKNRE